MKKTGILLVISFMLHFAALAQCNWTYTTAITDADCNNTGGIIDLTVTGGTSPYTYFWSNGDTTEDLSGLASGYYYVAITDATGCTNNDSLNYIYAYVEQQNAINITFNTTQAICKACDGTATIAASGGTSPYVYLWSTGGTASTETGLCVGSYSVTVTDTNGCSSSQSVYINNKPSFSTSITKTDADCNNTGGAIDLTVTGGTAPYTYLWSNGETTEDISGLASGFYSVTITDATGCNNNDSLNYIYAYVEQQIVDATITPAGPFCTSDASVQLASPNTGGTWSGVGVNSTGLFTPFVAGVGTHTIWHTISGVCSDSSSISIIIKNDFDATITSPVRSFCEYDSPIQLTSVDAGGMWYGYGLDMDTIMGISFNPSFVGAGTHIIIYTISGACGDADTVSIVVNPSFVATITPAGPFCTSDAPFTLQAVPTGGTWSGTGVNAGTGVFTPSVAGSGTYRIQYSITSGTCSDTDSIDIVVVSSPDATIAPAGPFCTSDDADTLHAVDGGGTWSGTGVTNAAIGIFNPTVSNAGTITITYTISGTCGDTSTVVIAVLSSPDATIFGPVGPFCITDAPVQLTAVDSGGSWNGMGIVNTTAGTFVPSGSSVGTYTITYTIMSSVYNCADEDSIDVVIVDCNVVWPGDANADGVANNFDILPIGVGYGTTGSIRTNASINWVAQTASDWTDSLASGINYKHIDCNGDGTINDNDTTAIVQNYGQTRWKFNGTNKATSADPTLYFEFKEDTILPSTALAVPLMFGSSTIPATNVYGMAFTVSYDPSLVDSASGVHMTFNNSWLGTYGSDMISVQKNFHSDGELEIGVTKINHSNVSSGFGQIGTMYIVMEDNLSGKKNQLETFSLSLSNVKVISNDESIVSIDLGDDSVVVQSTGINEFNALEKYFSVYPVPASDKLYIEYSNIQIDKIELLNMAGQAVISKSTLETEKLMINTSGLSKGIYLLKIETDKGLLFKKVSLL